MRGNVIVEIDGVKYLVERTFDGSPGIYYTGGLQSPVHIDDAGLLTGLQIKEDFISPIPDEAVVIVARIAEVSK